MKKIKLLMPLGILTLATAMMPLVSCGGKGNSGQDDPEEDYNALCFTDIAGDEIDSTIKFKVDSDSDESQVDIDLETSTDGKTWTDWFKTNEINVGSEPITLHNGEHVYVRNKTNKLSYGGGPKGSPEAHCQFIINNNSDGGIKISGNVNSMIHYSEVSQYCFNSLFSGNPAIKSIEGLSLPSTTLKSHCYLSMFYNCSGLETIPAGLLNANELEEFCYANMFADCSGLETIPENLLNADKLAESCYANMFYNCSGLETIPESLLNASTLAAGCYSSMFGNCTSLTTACKLPATDLVNGCYSQMFAGCTLLKIREDDGETTGANKIFKCPGTTGLVNPVGNMFYGNIGSQHVYTPTTGKTYYWYK